MIFFCFQFCMIFFFSPSILLKQSVMFVVNNESDFYTWFDELCFILPWHNHYATADLSATAVWDISFLVCLLPLSIVFLTFRTVLLTTFWKKLNLVWWCSITSWKNIGLLFSRSSKVNPMMRIFIFIGTAPTFVQCKSEDENKILNKNKKRPKKRVTC